MERITFDGKIGTYHLSLPSQPETKKKWHIPLNGIIKSLLVSYLLIAPLEESGVVSLTNHSDISIIPLRLPSNGMSIKPQSWTKVLRQFRKSNAFEQRTEFCTGMKTFFSSVITPTPTKQCCKTLRKCLFVSNIENGERGGYFSRRNRAEFSPRKKGGNFNVSQQLLSMIAGLQHRHLP